MADHTFLHDDILCNILARLPVKPLLRFRCVSTHWNRMLRQRSFMKLRSRRALILPLVKTLLLIDHNDNSVVPRPYPLEFNNKCEYTLQPIGTVNGLILFTYSHDLILYNPFTRLFSTLPSTPPLISLCSIGALGFGCSYGDTRDLKVVRFRQYRKMCYVFSLKEGSWSTIEYNDDVISIFQFYRRNVAGTHANGFLYWIACRKRESIIALNVKDMVLSEMSHLPFKKPSLLGTMNGGCNLCALDEGSIWVLMKEPHNQWSKIYSFQVRIRNCYTYLPLSVLDSGKILMMIGGSTRNLIVFDPSNNSYKKLDISLKDDDCYWRMHVLEYVESMVSPVYIMSRAWRYRSRKEDQIKEDKIRCL